MTCAGLGLAVAVVDLEPGGLAERRDHLGVERLAGRDHPPQRGQRAQLGPLGQHPVLGRRLAEDVDARALDQLEPLGGIEAAVVDARAAAPHQPGGDEDVAGRLRPAGRRRAPGELARRAAPNQCSAWTPLTGEVALGVHGAPRLAGRARGEDDQRRVLGAEVGRLGRASPGAVLVEDRRRPRPASSPARPPGSSPSRPSSPTHERGVGRRDPELEVGAAQLRVAGQRDRAHPPAGEHRQHPLDAVADQGHHDVAAPHAAGREGAREPGAARDQLAEVPDRAARRSRSIATSAGCRGREALQHVLDRSSRGATPAAAATAVRASPS